MLVRRPAAEVIDAFVNPAKITRFWLDGASAPLATGATVTWRFMVPGAHDTVTVTRFEPPRLIAFDWSDGSHVTLLFDATAPDITKVTVEMLGFNASASVADIVNAAEGFSIVLCDLKILLESGHSANLVRDKARLISGDVGS
jgi:uncharacterized protein YndB with AHSA1/START domain